MPELRAGITKVEMLKDKIINKISNTNFLPTLILLLKNSRQINANKIPIIPMFNG